MAKKKHSVNGRDSAGKRLGIKCSSGEIVPAGAIILRQRGRKFIPGMNVGLGSDDTLYSKISGRVEFAWAKGGIREVNVYPVPLGEVNKV